MQWFEYTIMYLSILLVYSYNWTLYSNRRNTFQLHATAWMLCLTRSSTERCQRRINYGKCFLKSLYTFIFLPIKYRRSYGFITSLIFGIGIINFCYISEYKISLWMWWAFPSSWATFYVTSFPETCLFKSLPFWEAKRGWGVFWLNWGSSLCAPW